MIQEDVPGEVKELLERQQLNGVPVLLSTTSDLSLTGDLAATGLSSPAIIWPSWPMARLRGWSTICRSTASRSSVPRGRSARAFSRPISIKRGSTSRASQTRWPRRFHLLADKLEDLRTTGEVVVHPEEEHDKIAARNAVFTLAQRAIRALGVCRARRSLTRLWQLLRPQWPTASGNVWL